MDFGHNACPGPTVISSAPLDRPVPTYAVIDTTFATVDMGTVAARGLLDQGVPEATIVRRTVPGFKDLGAACAIAFDEGADIAVACGMVGREPVDKECAADASAGIQVAAVQARRHILEVFVHMDEAPADRPDLLDAIARNRAYEHAVNAYWLLEAPDELRRRAGTGQRQGFDDEGGLDGRRVDGPAGAPPPAPAG